jgi:hypothetical protein
VKTKREIYYSKFIERNKKAAFWLRKRFNPRAARALSDSGILTLEDLRKLTREQFFGMKGLDEGSYDNAVRILGHELHSGRKFWQEKGLRAGTINVLVRHGIKDEETLRRYTRSQFILLPGIGGRILAEIESTLGFRFPSATRFWVDQGVPDWVADSLVRKYYLKSLEDVERIGLGVLRDKIKSSVIFKFLAAAVHFAKKDR